MVLNFQQIGETSVHKGHAETLPRRERVTQIERYHSHSLADSR